MTAKKKENDFEAAIERLEEITELLENGEATLEESIKLYTEGLDLANLCNKKLAEAEKKIKQICEKNGILSEVEMEIGEE
ncbi:MAG: exodeoxyribonuclease VII small subunit [bacterium]